jgi:hypothetical protein
MEADSVVLIGVMNRQVDFIAARDEGWYRIPIDHAPRIVMPDYVAFFFTRAFSSRNGGIYYFAARRGLELVRRRDLLPQEADHPRAESWYYRLALAPLQQRTPAILNGKGRRVTFITTTGQRFMYAERLDDLYL